MNFRFVAVAAFAAGLFPLVGLAQSPPPPAPASPPASVAPAAPKVYIPGLEQFMNVILTEHNKLWFAAKARNWPLAAYELGEIKEVMGDVQDFVPVFKSLPLAQMMDAVVTKEIVDLEKAIDEKDFRKFAAGYDALNKACNACHAGTENEFVVVKRPTTPAFTNQDYRPHKK
jgi:hypothetical protein